MNCDPFMGREFIARDPRTGLPISRGTKKQKAMTPQIEEGPFIAIPNHEIIPLAMGEQQTSQVMWRGKRKDLGRIDGIRALTRLHGRDVIKAHSALIHALQDDDSEIKAAALFSLPIVALQRSFELFDYLSVLLDDEDLSVRKAASICLEKSAPIFPSATESTLAFELRHGIASRSKHAWKALTEMCQTWPEVACLHIDEMLLEENVIWRRSASNLLKKLVHKKDASVWDLIGWALDDEDHVVRQNGAKCLPPMAQRMPKMATILAEKAIFDSDVKVIDFAIRCIESLDTDYGRARDMIVNACQHQNPNVRLACIKILPRIMGEDALRDFAAELRKSEKDPVVIKELDELLFDVQWGGSEDEKNAFLQPAPSVPQIDKEIIESVGKSVNMTPIRDVEDGRHG